MSGVAMRLVTTTSVTPGLALARDVLVNPAGGPLLRAGVSLTDGMRDALLASGVARVWIEDDLSEGIVPSGMLGERVRREALTAVADLHAAARRALSRRSRLDPRTLNDLERVAGRIADDVIEARGRPHDLLDLAPASHYLVHHAVDSAALAILIAARHMTATGWRQGTGPVRHDAPRSELARLGLGVLLCDVGMLTLSRAVLEDAGSLDDVGWEQIRQHPLTSAELLGTTTSFVLKGIVRGHHERIAGYGYPDGTTGEAIHYLARIAAIADAYDAMTADRHHRSAVAPSEAWASIVNGAGDSFDPSIVEAFRDVVARYPLGTDVTLADGRTGVVARVDLADPHALVVRVRDGDRIVELGDPELEEPEIRDLEL
jgi:HD-GYP domain-containing protein (c-di-GMP phosphodiesterase class II)